MKNLTSYDLLGKAFFPILYKNESEFFDEYFSLLNTIKKKLREFESKSLITGFYINRINSADVKNSLRVTYFVADKNKLIVEEKFRKISNYNDNNEAPKKFPLGSLFGSGYPDIDDLRGRQFLNTYCQIGLDLLEKLDVKSVYDLISRYRLKIIIDPQRKLYDAISNSKEDIKLAFADVFSQKSDFFNKLNSSLYSADNLWEDLARYRIIVNNNNSSIGFLGHFLVNMFLIPDEQVLISS
jgi:hypothetical protein